MRTLRLVSLVRALALMKERGRRSSLLFASLLFMVSSLMMGTEVWAVGITITPTGTGGKVVSVKVNNVAGTATAISNCTQGSGTCADANAANAAAGYVITTDVPAFWGGATANPAGDCPGGANATVQPTSFLSPLALGTGVAANNGANPPIAAAPSNCPVDFRPALAVTVIGANTNTVAVANINTMTATQCFGAANSGTTCLATNLQAGIQYIVTTAGGSPVWSGPTGCPTATSNIITTPTAGVLSCTADFRAAVKLTVTGSGSVSVTATLGINNCSASGGTCIDNGGGVAGTSYMLSASVTPVTWGGPTGCPSGTGQTATVTYPSSGTLLCTANFGNGGSSTNNTINLTVAGTGTVTSAGGTVATGSTQITNCSSTGGTCSAQYTAAVGTVTLTATPGAGMGVTWSGTDCPAATTLTKDIALTATAKTYACTATFAAVTNNVVNLTVTGTGTVSSSGGTLATGSQITSCSSTGGAACSAQYTAAVGTVTLTASPGAGMGVTWGGADCPAATTPTKDIALTATAKTYACTATFAAVTNNVVNLTVTGTGTVSSAGGTLATGSQITSCSSTGGAACSAQYTTTAGTVTLTATPGVGMGVTWGGADCPAATTSTKDIALTTTAKTYACTATFAAVTNNVVNLTVTGTGTVSSAGGTLATGSQITSCSSTGGAACSAQYTTTAGTVTLTATPGVGMGVTWGGADCPAATTSTKDIALTATAKTYACTATFAPVTNNVVNLTVTGTGTVTSSGGTLATGTQITSCSATGGTCSAQYTAAVGTVTLTASPGAGMGVTWGGADCPAATTLTKDIALTATAKTYACTATFAPVTNNVVNLTVTGTGTVTSSGGTLATGTQITSCSATGGAACRAQYTTTAGTVTLTTTPTTGVTWTGTGCTAGTNGTATVALTNTATAYSCTATFAPVTSNTINVTIAGSTLASVTAVETPTPSSGGIKNCTAGGTTNCSATYTTGPVTLVANPGETVTWTGTGCTPGASGTATVNLTGTPTTYSCTATFAPNAVPTTTPPTFRITSGILVGSWIHTSTSEETPTEEASFTVTADKVPTADVIIYYLTNGTAVSGGDYTGPLATSGLFTFNAGSISQHVTALDVYPIDDHEVEGKETVVITLTADNKSPATYYIDATANTASIDITNDNDLTIEPTLMLTEPNINGQLTIKTEVAPTKDTVINYTVSGTATSGKDYDPLLGNVILRANTKSVTIPVIVKNDEISEGEETIVVKINDTTREATLIVGDDEPQALTQRVYLFPPEATAFVIGNEISPTNPVGSPTRCVNLGITSGSFSPIAKTFTVGSTTDVAHPDNVTNIGFVPNPDNTFRLTGSRSSTSTSALENLAGLTRTATGTNGSFDITFTPPASTVTTATPYNRTLQVFTNDPAAKPIEVPIGVFVVPDNKPKLQVTCSNKAIANATADPVSLTATLGDGNIFTTCVLENRGYDVLKLRDATASFSEGGNGFTVSAFDKIEIAKAAPGASASPGKCPEALNTYDKASFTVKLNTSTAGTFNGTLSFVSNDGGRSDAAFTFPIKGTVNPPVIPLTKPEITVWLKDKEIAHNTTEVVDFGTTKVGTPVEKTFTLKNTSTVNLSVFDVNPPVGFVLVNSNYDSTVLPGKSLDIILKMDATTAGSFTGELRIANNDSDNGTGDNNDGVENPFTFPVKGTVTTDGGSTGGGGTTNPVTLTVSKNGNGVITSPDSKVQCGTNATKCEVIYETNQTVTLTATPDTGSNFTEWTGGCQGNTNPLAVIMDKSKSCTATFGEIDKQKTLTFTSPENGAVTSETGSFNCGTSGNTCSVKYASGQKVALNATPADALFNFAGWGGDCSSFGTTNPANVILTEDMSCTAKFTKLGAATLNFSAPDNGSIKSKDGKVDCGIACTTSYDVGNTVELTASSLSENFESWKGNCTGTNNPLTVTITPEMVTQAWYCTAQFKPKDDIAVTKDCFDEGMGLLANGDECKAAKPVGSESSTGQPTTTEMRGGLSKYDGPYEKYSTVTLLDPIKTAGVIKVEPADIGKQVDIVVIGRHDSEFYGPPGFAWYMMAAYPESPLGWTIAGLPHDPQTGKPVLTKSELKALKTVDKLPEYYTVYMYSGNLVYAGSLEIYFGYRVEGTGKTVLSMDPIKLSILPIPDLK